MQHNKLKALAVVSQKGGTGKTTLAVNLAVHASMDGLNVAVIDCDPQRSAAGWWGIRQHEWPTLIERPAHELPSILATLEEEGFNLAIIDTRPSVEGETLRAVQSATAAIISSRPTSFDLRAIALTAQLVRDSGKSGCIVLNQCPPPRSENEPSITAEARSVAASLGLPVAPATVSIRVAIPYAASGGMAACEYEPDGNATKEIAALWQHIKGEYLNG